MFVRSSLVMVFVLLATILVACGDDESISSQFSGDESDAAVEEPAMDMAEDMPAADADYATDDSGRGETAAQIDFANVDRRVIRNGELHLMVTDVQSAARQARETVADRGGYEASSSAQALNEDEARTNISFEVPADSFDEIMGLLRESNYVVRVENESTSSQDVTEEFVDLESQLTNLEATESRFVELLDEAHTISDVLSVENEITRVRGEIERIKGRLNYLEQRTDYSRIHVTYEETVDDEVTIAGQHFTPGETASEAWNSSLEFVGSVGNALIAVVVFFWWGWPLLGLAAFLVSQYRRRRRTETASA